jgi:hypothetical protein
MVVVVVVFIVFYWVLLILLNAILAMMRSSSSIEFCATISAAIAHRNGNGEGDFFVVSGVFTNTWAKLAGRKFMAGRQSLDFFSSTCPPPPKHPQSSISILILITITMAKNGQGSRTTTERVEQPPTHTDVDLIDSSIRLLHPSD